jgi:hypothetical protein
MVPLAYQLDGSGCAAVGSYATHPHRLAQKVGGEREILAAGAQTDVDDFFHDFFKLRLTS